MAIRGSGFLSEILHREGLYASEDFRKKGSIGDPSDAHG